jgi:predicted outer membrane repeat protein
MGTPGPLNRLFYLHPLALCAIALYAIALPAHATTLTVTNTNDNGPGSLRDTLAAATDGDTITFDVTGSIVLTTGELLVNKSLTISGPGSDNLAIDGNASSRVFYIAPDQTVSITGLTVTNGMTNEDGGGIYNDHGSLALSACAITGNSANNGGGIYSDGFESVDNGGSAELTIDSSTINGNLAQVGGGGIFDDGNDQGSATLEISNSIISNNTAGGGGGVENEGTVWLTINSCTISGNSASAGGAIDSATLETVDVLSITIDNSTFSDNSATLGGAIFSGSGDIKTQATVTLNQSLFTNNSADFGGAIYIDGDLGEADLTSNDSTFSGNSASANGGAIYNDQPFAGSAAILLNNSILTDNTAGENGGAIYNDQGEPTINYSSISGNSAQKYGGGIYNNGFPVTAFLYIDSSTLSGNSAQVGGGIYNDGHQGAAHLHISNSTISGNTASSDSSLASRGYGGGLASNGDNARIVSVDISNTTFSDNAASHAGGSIYNIGQSDTVFVTLANTILKSGPVGGNIFSNSTTIESLGYNLSNDNASGFLTGPGDQTNIDPMLGPLQDNGGPTLTHALLPGSPAIDAGDPNFAPPPVYDQRGTGFDRVVNGRLDIGSFEVQTSMPVPSPRLGPPSRSRPIAMRRPTPP